MTTVTAQLRRSSRDRFLAALNAAPQDRPPVWFMRQAGRHLPGYRALRERSSFLDLCRDPEVNRIASAEPFHRYGVDAVIVFNDILIPLRDMGMKLDFLPAPRFERLATDPRDIAELTEPAYDEHTDVARCLSTLRREVGDGVAMLGFIGAPFTVSAFAIAGVGANREPLPVCVSSRRAAFDAMQHRLVGVLAEYARVQVDAGADAIQIFESLAEQVAPSIYREIGLPSLLSTIAAVRERCPATPIIVFGRGLQDVLADLAARGVALSIEPTLRLTDVRSALSAQGLFPALQGNLDPESLRRSPAEAGAAARELLTRWRDIIPRRELAASHGPTGWVFNLGHGVPADANPESVQAVVDAVREVRAQPAPADQEVAS